MDMFGLFNPKIQSLIEEKKEKLRLQEQYESYDKEIAKTMSEKTVEEKYCKNQNKNRSEKL